MNTAPRTLRLLTLFVGLLMLAGCRGCSGGTMSFEELLGSWRFDMETALKNDPSFAEQSPETQRLEREKFRILQDSFRITYTKDELLITMLLSREAAAARAKGGKPASRVRELVRDKIIGHEVGPEKNLVLRLRGKDGDERSVTIRRIDENHIEMVQAGAQTPNNFRFLERLP